MRPRPISDDEWFGIRHAARRRDWQEVAQRAEALGWQLVAAHARRAAVSVDALTSVAWALRLDKPDEPDPFRTPATADRASDG